MLTGNIYQILDTALVTGRMLEISYQGYRRIVEVRDRRVGKYGQTQALCWQHSGGSKHDIPGWRLFNVAEISHPVLKETAMEQVIELIDAVT